MPEKDISGKVKKKYLPTSAEVSHFFYHKDKDGTPLYFGGRTSQSWGCLLLFYFIYYCFLLAFWVMCFLVMLDSLKAWDQGPRLQDIIKENDGIYMNMAPGFFDAEDTIKTFPNTPAAAAEINLRIENYLETTDQGIAGVVEQVRTFCGSNLGYSSAAPCFFLFINRIRGRQLYTPTVLPPDVAPDAGGVTDINVFHNRVINATGDANAAFLPATCFLAEDADLPPGAGRDDKFQVRSFMNVDGVATSVPGFAFREFANSFDSLLYRDPIVVVKPNGLVPEANGVIAREVDCKFFFRTALHRDDADHGREMVGQIYIR